MTVCAVVGGQYGSEGKGLIVGHLAERYRNHVRVGAANAGHTLYTGPHGEKRVMQQLPCAAYANPDANLYIGPGALISPEILEREARALGGWRKQQGLGAVTVWIDERAHVIQEHHKAKEAASGLEARIGSTSATAQEGIGAAQAARVMREESCVQAIDHYIGDVDHRGITYWDEEPGVLLRFVDVPLYLNQRVWNRDTVLLEGTQGAGLSLVTGDFPYVTSRCTTSAGLCADAGVDPTALSRVTLVVRTYPIRVAGNSGPFHPESEELSWHDISVDPQTERTTVTRKVRRVATFSVDQVFEAAMLNGATEIALTFCDYLEPRIGGESTLHSGTWNKRDLSTYPEVRALVDRIEQTCAIPVTMLGTGPRTVIELGVT